VDEAENALGQTLVLRAGPRLKVFVVTDGFLHLGQPLLVRRIARADAFLIQQSDDALGPAVDQVADHLVR